MNTKISAIRGALDFIERHLGEEITVGDIADSAGYSLYHFIRTFNQVVKHSPYDFLMRRRLTEAARELLASERKILDIALDNGFNNHETFSRAFKRMFQIQPNQWRGLQVHLDQVYLPALTDIYLAHINQPDFVSPECSTSDSGSLVQFYHPGPASRLHLTISYIHHTWLPQSETQLAYLPAGEHFFPKKMRIGLVAKIPSITQDFH